MTTINASIDGGELNRYRIDNMAQYPAGSYIISVKVGMTSYKVKILK
ncbi:MAG: hypothetical protein ACJA1N_001723 [Saprospiraceae bacterium]